MELQGLQEALKVEIQCHQLAVRSCPVGTPAKPLSLIKPPSQSIAISVVPAKAPVSMVTAHINGQKAASSEALQTSPINLQTANRAHRTGEMCHSQMLGTLTAVPIKVPQVSSLHRLAGQSPTVLPQVRPKTLIPDSLPHSPCQEQQSSQPLSLACGTAVVSPKSTFNPERVPSGQGEITSPPLPISSVSTASPGVAYAIISATSPAANGVAAMSEAVKVQPLIFSPDSKVIIIQPQIPSSSQASQGPQAEIPCQEPSPAPASPHKPKKKEEDPEKIAFMVALGLVTTEHLEEIQSKRQERKRRSTANPAYSSLFDPERKRLAANYLNNPLFLSARDSEDLCWKEELEHDNHCSECKEEGNLQQCQSCPRAYHLDCLHPPLKSPPKGTWMCPKCQKKVLNKENLSWPHNFVQSYVTHKTVREEEKRRLMRRNIELKKECTHLKEEDQRLSKSLSKCRDAKERLLSQQRETQASLERLRTLIRLIQRDHMIQVTMTATTTTSGGAALLSLPWIKPNGTSNPSGNTAPPAGPSALLHKSALHSQGNN